MPPGLEGFDGELLHAFDYPGAEPFRGRAGLVYGNGISGCEIASDLARVKQVTCAFRKPRYVIQKNVGGVSSDWQWYTAFGALERQQLRRDELEPADARARAARRGRPSRLRRARAGPDPLTRGPRALPGLPLRRATADRLPADDRRGRGPRRDVRRRLARAAWTRSCARRATTSTSRTSTSAAAPGARPTSARCIPTRLASASSASSSRRARTSRCSSCRRAGSSRSGPAPSRPPTPADARRADAAAAARCPQRVRARRSREELGVAPDLLARPELTEALLFGPMLPPRYRFDGRAPSPKLRARFADQLAASPRPPVDPADIDALGGSRPSPGFELAPAAGAVVGDDLPEHRQQRRAG